MSGPGILKSFKALVANDRFQEGGIGTGRIRLLQKTLIGQLA